MVTVNLNGTRPKLTLTNALVADLADAATIASGVDGIDLPIRLTSTVLDTVTIADVDTVDTTTAISSVGGGFSGVKVGAVLSGNANIPVGAVITSITDDNNAVIDLAATGTGTSSTDFDATADLTVAVLRVNLSLGGNTLTVRPLISKLNGSSVTDVSSGNDGLTFADGTQVNLSAQTIDLDAFLTNAGVAKTN